MIKLRTLTLLMLLSISGAVAFAQTNPKMLCYSIVKSSDRPLYVVAFSKKNVRTLANPQATDSLNKIMNWTYIKDLEVFKDAASTTAIYGSRAQNGVIIFHVKKEFSRKAYKELKQYLD